MLAKCWFILRFLIIVQLLIIISNLLSITMNFNKMLDSNDRILFVSGRGSTARRIVVRQRFEGSNKWPNGVVHYQISASLRRYRNIILAAMERIESTTCIKFRERQSKQQKDYVLLTNGDGYVSIILTDQSDQIHQTENSDSCHSIVGRAGGKQVISLGTGCRDVGSIIHELCHTIGLYHEHMRYDRDQYLRIIWKNISPGMMDQFEKVPKREYHPAHKFDYNSIMIYGSKAFSKNGRDTMVPKEPGARIVESHFKRRLASSDMVNIKAMYNC